MGICTVKPRLATITVILASACFLTACATAPKTRIVNGPIVLDAPDSVVRAENPAPPASDSQTPPPEPVDPSYENVQSVPVTPVTIPDCPSGTVAQDNGTCMLIN